MAFKTTCAAGLFNFSRTRAVIWLYHCVNQDIRCTALPLTLADTKTAPDSRTRRITPLK